MIYHNMAELLAKLIINSNIYNNNNLYHLKIGKAVIKKQEDKVLSKINNKILITLNSITIIVINHKTKILIMYHFTVKYN